jgi:hypothetical protein
MNGLFTAGQIELLTGLLSFVFTVGILSYVVGDNPLYRLTLHLFIGVVVGYGTLVIIYQVLQPRLIAPLFSGNISIIALTVIPLVLFIFLALKISPRTAPLGNISVAYLIGVGTAVAVGGALTGTLVPQVGAAWVSILPGAPTNFLNNFILVVGTITTLLYFQFWLRGRTAVGEIQRVAVLHWLSVVGQFFLTVTLGVIYGGMILSGLAIFGERISALSQWITGLMQ